VAIENRTWSFLSQLLPERLRRGVAGKGFQHEPLDGSYLRRLRTSSIRAEIAFP